MAQFDPSYNQLGAKTHPDNVKKSQIDQDYGAMRQQGYGIVPASINALSGGVNRSIVKPVASSLGNASSAIGGLGKNLFAVPGNQSNATQGKGLGQYRPTTADYGIQGGQQWPLTTGWGLRPDQLRHPSTPSTMQQDTGATMDYLAKTNGGEAVSKGKGGTIRYAKDGNGNIIRQNAGTGEISPLQSSITENVQGGKFNPVSGWRSAGLGFDQINRAIDAGHMTPEEGLAYYKQLNMSPEERAQIEQQGQQNQLNELLDIAINGGPNGGMSPTEFGAAKRRQRFAIQGLGLMGNFRQDQARNDLMGRQIDYQRQVGQSNAEAEKAKAQAEAEYRRGQLGIDAQKVGVDRERLGLERFKAEQDAYQPVTLNTFDANGFPSGQRAVPFNKKTGQIMGQQGANGDMQALFMEALSQAKTPEEIQHLQQKYAEMTNGQ